MIGALAQQQNQNLRLQKAIEYLSIFFESDPFSTDRRSINAHVTAKPTLVSDRYR